VLLENRGDQERLSFIEGEVGNDPLQPYMLSDAIVIEAARLLRRLHDATQDFVVPIDAQFMLPLPADMPHEVICHNDFAPYNCVFRDQHIVGLIDFDTAAPGARLWDIAYAVYRFVPLQTDAHCRDMGWTTPPDRWFRLKLFCDTYGLEDRSALAATIIQRLEALVHYMRDTSSNLDHLPVYLDDLRYIRENQAQINGDLRADN
jgi:aminoglycoside phosphotransferase (APT) family kinase protein